MELRLAGSFLPLLLLAWLPTVIISETVSQTAESISNANSTIMKCKFHIWSTNVTVLVEYKPKGLEMWNQTNTTAVGENCTDIISPCMDTVHVENCELAVFIEGINSTDAVNDTKRRAPRCCPPRRQTSVTEKIWTGSNLLCVFFGLWAGTLIYMPVIGFLLWQFRRQRTGKRTIREVAEGNQLSRAAPVTGTEDLTYANLDFEESGTKPAASNTIYSEVKPSQQQ